MSNYDALWKEAEALALKVQGGDESTPVIGRLCELHKALLSGHVEPRVKSAAKRPGKKSGILDAKDFFQLFDRKMLRNLRNKMYKPGNYGGWVFIVAERSLNDYVEDPSLGDHEEEDGAAEGEAKGKAKKKKEGFKTFSIDKAVSEEEGAASFADLMEDEADGGADGPLAVRIIKNDYLTAARTIKSPEHAAAFFGRVFLGMGYEELMPALGLKTPETVRSSFLRALCDIRDWFGAHPDYGLLATGGLGEFAQQNFIIDKGDLEKVSDRRSRQVLALARQHSGSFKAFVRDLGVSRSEARSQLRKAIAALSQALLTRRRKAPKADEAALSEGLWKFCAELLERYPERVEAVRADGSPLDPDLASHMEAYVRVVYLALGVHPEDSMGALLRKNIQAEKYAEASLRLGISRQDLRRLLTDGFKVDEVTEGLIGALSSYTGLSLDALRRARSIPPARGTGITRALTEEERKKYEEVLSRRKV